MFLKIVQKRAGEEFADYAKLRSVVNIRIDSGMLYIFFLGGDLSKYSLKNISHTKVLDEKDVEKDVFEAVDSR